MRRKEINRRSPMRALEETIHGGLGEGNIGVVVARPGVGKTAFLVGMALDVLMRDRRVLHISLHESMDRIRSFYDEVFQDLAHERELENVWKVRADVERNRRIHCFTGRGFCTERFRQTLTFMRDHTDFSPQTIIVDGWDFEAGTDAELAEWKQIATEINAEIWMSASTTRAADVNERGVPEPVARHEAALDVILGMAHDGKRVHVTLHKDHDRQETPELQLALDPTTLLLVNE